MDLATFNLAILKWYWKWAKPQQNLMNPLLAHMPITQEMMPHTELFTIKAAGAFWNISVHRIIGNGKKTSFWLHDWGCGVLKERFADLYSYTINDGINVREALEMGMQSLLRDQLSDSAQEQLLTLTNEITGRQILNMQREDDVTWRWASNGSFTVRSAYKAIKNGPRVATNTHIPWSIKAPPRFKVFAWIMTLNRILTIDNLIKKGMHIVNRCVMCKNALETVKHLFGECQTAKALYREVRAAYQLVLGTGTARMLVQGRGTPKEKINLAYNAVCIMT
ncbi:uncharacterized protein LOC144564966 [Carex rostrata]